MVWLRGWYRAAALRALLSCTHRTTTRHSIAPRPPTSGLRGYSLLVPW